MFIPSATDVLLSTRQLSTNVSRAAATKPTRVSYPVLEEKPQGPQQLLALLPFCSDAMAPPSQTPTSISSENVINQDRESAMDMVRVNSSAITAVAYDPATGRMKIMFKQGRTYDYCGVPPNIHQGLMEAGSKGNYFDRMIRDRYQC
ncbi:KTSC domain-containing protein [Pseudomonas syringae]|uniref:KTSC domain-containing protein n=1 Tax=Pseudomonas syringae TaxID=317 RepID=UPI0032D9A60D